MDDLGTKMDGWLRFWEEHSNLEMDDDLGDPLRKPPDMAIMWQFSKGHISLLGIVTVAEPNSIPTSGGDCEHGHTVIAVIPTAAQLVTG